jgi:hypothetical protein
LIIIYKYIGELLRKGGMACGDSQSSLHYFMIK